MYKLIKGRNEQICVVTHQINNVLYSIPFALDNTDYANFKKSVAEGAELQDADGNVMSEQAAQAFVGTLP